MAVGAGDLAAIVESDTRLHGLLVEMGGRARLVELWHALDGQMGALMRSSLEFQGHDLAEVVAANVAIYGHPTSSVPMGGPGDPSAVVDSVGAVKGVSGLRVVDASAMPYVTNGNIYAPVMMLAEKSADLILGNTPLPPSAAAFYRHERDSGQRPAAK